MPQIPKRSRIDGSHVALTASCSKMRTIYDMAIPQLGRILKGKARQMQHSSISFAIQQEIGLAMTIAYGNHAPTPTRPGGKHKGIVVCWFLGLGSLVSWNSMLTIGDYYYCLFPKYHPSRVLTLVYQPFALGTMAILAYNEAKINTRKRNVAGYILFAASGFSHMEDEELDLLLAYVQLLLLSELQMPMFKSFFAGLAASGALTSALRLITKAAFDKSKDGPRKGVSIELKFGLRFKDNMGPGRTQQTVTSYTSQAKANQNHGGSGQAEWIIHLSKWFSFSSIRGTILRVFSCSVKSKYIPLVECFPQNAFSFLQEPQISSQNASFGRKVLPPQRTPKKENAFPSRKRLVCSAENT
ncbi:hypothetical protein NC652_027417 [Populus alba x Populus x berolinensis]|nr:hypothetical protein NC652_027417 [Populus alba x Populus x berolinensis]